MQQDKIAYIHLGKLLVENACGFFFLNDLPNLASVNTND